MIKKTASSAVKNEIMQNKKLAEELIVRNNYYKPIITNFEKENYTLI